ncbi:MAG: hypothetical protein V4677_04405 [Bacteroidota bacterium]
MSQFSNGVAENYIKISHPFDEALVNRSVSITTKALNEEGFVNGELVPVLV